MAENHDELKTVRLSTDEIKDIALAQEEARRIAAGEPEPPPFHDGRFGENFDDELNAASVVWVSIGIAVITLVGFLGSWWLYQWMTSQQKAATPAPTPIVAEARADESAQRKVPSGPLLQASPEEELVEMRHEMHQLTHGYGWIDEAAGTVYIPIDKVIDKVLETGLGSAGTPGSLSDLSDASNSSETAPSQEADGP